MLLAPHESMFRPDSVSLQSFADCLTLLLRNGAEPWLPVPVASVWYRDTGWWHGQRGYLRYEEVVKNVPDLVATYFHVVHTFYPEVVVDDDGDVFWNAKRQK